MLVETLVNCPVSPLNVRVPLQYTLADRNAHIPDSDNGRYMAVPVSLGASGSQIFGSPTDNAKIWKIEMHSLYVLLIDTDQIKQRLLWPTFEECLQHLMAHEYMSISSFTPFHQTVGRMPGWTAFLKDVQSLCLDGTMTVTFVKRIFSRLPKTLKKFAFLPHQSTVDMPAEDALNRVPKAVQHLTFDTTCFPQGDLVTAVGLLPFKSENKYERLVLFGRRFPSGPVLQAFFDRLEEISLPGASVTLFTSNTPNDAIIGPLLDRGFVRGNRHLRPYGAHYDMYKLRCNLKFRIGFLVPKIDPQQEEDDDDDWP
uniref:Uncharacterized protein n=1 Tax=Panagrolaimus superbus TaxID=310955 RepID=A0A914YEA8_9BILA